MKNSRKTINAVLVNFRADYRPVKQAIRGVTVVGWLRLIVLLDTEAVGFEERRQLRLTAE